MDGRYPLRKYALIAFAVLGLGVGATQAAQTTPQTLSIALKPTDWNSILEFNKFDSKLGTLTGVQFDLGAHIQGTAAFENTANAAATITTQLQADVSVGGTGKDLITSASLTNSTSDKAAAFDGTADFAGASGKTYTNLTADKSSSVTLSDAASLARFTGAGVIDLPISSLGHSTASGLGNLITQFTTSAAATGTLTYLYNAAPTPPAGQTTGGNPPPPQPVPEPTSIALTACGGLGLMLLARRRAAKKAA
jgi:hypothetical protein